MNPLGNTILKLQYQYSKLFIISLPRRKFNYAISDNKFIASNTSRNTVLSIIFCAFASLFLITGFIEFYKNKFNVSLEFILTNFIVQTLVGVLALRQLLWLVNGEEIIMIENDFVTISKKGTFWVRSHIYELKYIDFIQDNTKDYISLYDKIQYNIKLNPLVIFGMTTGEISFNYKTKNILLFSNLHKEERLLVVEYFRKLKRDSL